MTPPQGQQMDREGPREECGVFGVYAPGHDVARLAYFGLYALQHRGQESAGIATAEGGHITTLRDSGLVSQVFDEEKLKALAGDMAIGHVRYSTTGGGSWENAQPVWRDDGRELALAHNGNLTNAVELWSELKEDGVAFRGTSDSEIIAALISSHEGRFVEDAVAAVMPRLEGAYSTVAMTKHAVVALTEALYHEIQLMQAGVGVSVLCPAWVNTKIVDSGRNRPAGLANENPELSPIAQTLQDFTRQVVDAGAPPEVVAGVVVQCLLSGLCCFSSPATAKAVFSSGVCGR